MENIEKIIKQIESEKDFEKVVELFASAAKMVKDVVKATDKQKGRITEIIRDLDSFVEKPTEDK
ncbi:MAG: hypothetical protein FWC00_05740 [Firmicutes bacterium]|nr:hypothetical protein [Bacillota bacterium]